MLASPDTAITCEASALGSDGVVAAARTSCPCRRYVRRLVAKAASAWAAVPDAWTYWRLFGTAVTFSPCWVRNG